jgi:hypothetical protein
MYSQVATMTTCDNNRRSYGNNVATTTTTTTTKIFGKWTTKFDDIIATFAGKGWTIQKILENYRLPHKKITFAFARMVLTKPNLLHNSDKSEVIPWPKSTSQIYFFLPSCSNPLIKIKPKKLLKHFDRIQSPKSGS